MILHNATHLDTRRLEALFRQCAAPWPLDGLDVRVRYTRSSPFSGLCVYQTGRIHVNIGRRNRYPYAIRTHVARAKTTRRAWWRPMHVVHVSDAYQLALFIFLHELYHWLIRKARRNTRQKEGRCDRFAVRALVERFGVSVLDHEGRPVPRDSWDFQDLDAFVARALPTRKRPSPTKRGAPTKLATAAIRSLNGPAAHHTPAGVGAAARQLMLFGAMEREWEMRNS
ncbi:MAG: hypothetical protein HUU22_06950 [Phycisphaerae bacterium]|nr:hypothetical protein [Phycisphaerae bacterium]NUQ45753.1 hypothetical protein [Phycisphaerae bacterium]